MEQMNDDKHITERFLNVIKTLRNEDSVLQWRNGERSDRVGDIEWVFSKVEMEANRILGNKWV